MTLQLEKLLERAHDPFHLVIAASRRARQLNAGAPKLTDVKAAKNTTIGLYEIMEGRITFKKLEDSADAPGVLNGS